MGPPARASAPALRSEFSQRSLRLAEPPLTALHQLVLAWLARHSPARVDDAAEALGLPTPLTRALVAELQLAELIESTNDL
jgi:predicted ArsR family transcriptional regulator